MPFSLSSHPLQISLFAFRIIVAFSALHPLFFLYPCGKLTAIGYTPSVTLRVPAPSEREPFGAVIRLKGSLFEGAGWPLGQTEGVSQGDAEL